MNATDEACMTWSRIWGTTTNLV